MDEPFAAVDAATEAAIVRILHELKDAGRTTLVVHHDLQTVPQYFDWVILLNMRIVASGPTKDVFTHENLHKTYGGKLTLLSEAAEAIARGGGASFGSPSGAPASSHAFSVAISTSVRRSSWVHPSRGLHSPVS